MDRELELFQWATEARVGGRSVIAELGQAGADQAGVGAGEEQGGPKAKPGDPVTVAPRDALDEPAEAEPAELVAEPALAELVGTKADEGRQVPPEVSRPERGGLQPKDDERLQQRLDPLVGEAQGGHPAGRRPRGTW